METQETIKEWADSVGINPTFPRAVERAAEEMDEALIASYSNDKESTAFELADVMITVYIAASVLGVDIHSKINEKMEVNRSRKWKRDNTGCVYHE